MSCEVAQLTFQANAKYGTLLKDFACALLCTRLCKHTHTAHNDYNTYTELILRNISYQRKRDYYFINLLIEYFIIHRVIETCFEMLHEKSQSYENYKSPNF